MKRNKTRSINIQRNAFMRGVLLIANCELEMTASSCILAVRIINLQLTAAWERCYILPTMPVINLADIQQITKTQQQVLFPSQKYHPNRSAFDSIVAGTYPTNKTL